MTYPPDQIVTVLMKGIDGLPIRFSDLSKDQKVRIQHSTLDSTLHLIHVPGFIPNISPEVGFSIHWKDDLHHIRTGLMGNYIINPIQAKQSLELLCAYVDTSKIKDKPDEKYPEF